MNLAPTKVPGPFGPRQAWPHIVQYRTRDGELHDCPPRVKPWTLDIHDLPAYEALAGTGAIYRPEHTGRRGAFTDNRTTA